MSEICLLQVVAVDPQPQPLFQDFVGAREIDMNRLPGLGVVSVTEAAVRVMVFRIPQVVQPPGSRPLGGEEDGGRPVGIEGKEVAPGVELLVVVVLAGGEDHLQFDPVHENGPLLPHDGVPLEEGTDQEVSETAPVVFHGDGKAEIQVQGHVGDDDVQPPFASEKDGLVRLVDELGEADPCIELFVGGRGQQSVTVFVGEFFRPVILNVLGKVESRTRGRTAVQEARKPQVQGRKVIGQYRTATEQGKGQEARCCAKQEAAVPGQGQSMHGSPSFNGLN